MWGSRGRKRRPGGSALGRVLGLGDGAEELLTSMSEVPDLDPGELKVHPILVA
jgi:hypothetical protein